MSLFLELATISWLTAIITQGKPMENRPEEDMTFTFTIPEHGIHFSELSRLRCPIVNRHDVEIESWELLEQTWDDKTWKPIHREYGSDWILKIVVKSKEENLTGVYECEREVGKRKLNQTVIVIAIQDSPEPHVCLKTHVTGPIEVNEGKPGAILVVDYKRCEDPTENSTVLFGWRKDGVLLERNDRIDFLKTDISFVLRIKDTVASDTGNYTVTAQLNEHGPTANWTGQLYVRSPPRFVNESIPDKQFLNVPAYSSVNLSCDYIEVYPSPEIRWLKYGTPLNLSQEEQGRPTLFFPEFTPEDKGHYTCEVENGVNILQREFYLDVLQGESPSQIPGRVLGEGFFGEFFKAKAEGLGNNHNLTTVAVKMVKENAEYGLDPLPISIVLAVFVFIACLALLLFFKIFWPKFRQKGCPPDQLDLKRLLNFDLSSYDKEKWEIPESKIKLGRVLGEGVFGQVLKTEVEGLGNNAKLTTVAVKIVKEKDDKDQLKALVTELLFFARLGNHLNILRLLGAVTVNIHKGELKVIMEYCHHGNLRNYLLRHQGHFTDQLDPLTGNVSVLRTPTSGEDLLPHYLSNVLAPNGKLNEYYLQANQIERNPIISSSLHRAQSTKSLTSITDSIGFETTTMNGPTKKAQNSLCTSDLLCFAFQCARGMEYLASKKLIHRDLAARNVLLAEGNVIKISDFGLAKNCYKDDAYVRKNGCFLPVKWMAIESIFYDVFTTKSDVWSFGVFLWELFSLGSNPYPGMNLDENFYWKLKNGYRMEKPAYAPYDVYALMKRCWHEKPEQRPTFDVLARTLEDLQEDDVKQHYLDLNNSYSTFSSKSLSSDGENGEKDNLINMQKLQDSRTSTSPPEKELTVHQQQVIHPEHLSDDVLTSNNVSENTQCKTAWLGELLENFENGAKEDTFMYLQESNENRAPALPGPLEVVPVVQESPAILPNVQNVYVVSPCELQVECDEQPNRVDDPLVKLGLFFQTQFADTESQAEFPNAVNDLNAPPFIGYVPATSFVDTSSLCTPTSANQHPSLSSCTYTSTWKHLEKPQGIPE